MDTETQTDVAICLNCAPCIQTNMHITTKRPKIQEQVPRERGSRVAVLSVCRSPQRVAIRRRHPSGRRCPDFAERSFRMRPQLQNGESREVFGVDE
ncbi:hypothetical protein Zmor_002090 [Zophobas morio]|uniref:Uncharacterized protein n=1 Tax=Zophobas morio TaxID=2755281 RepID=A0AA38J3F9_9CUCU|nr:hypothetical protein Zmor_002090 [Zophobas morio]